MTTLDPNTLLMGGGGGKSASFPNVGDKIAGEIIGLDTAQQTDLQGNPKTWDDGKPRMQLVVTLATDLREDGDDDGARKLYAKGSKKNPTSLLGAIAAAVTAAGKQGLAIGGTLHVAYIGDGEPSKPGFNPPKQYAAKYEPPAPVNQAAVDDIFAD